jgi:hypothetical protein
MREVARGRRGEVAREEGVVASTVVGAAFPSDTNTWAYWRPEVLAAKALLQRFVG